RALAWAAAVGLVLGLALVGVAAERRARALEREKQARREVDAFRKQADEMRFHALVTSPVPGQAAFHDPHQGEQAGQKALTLAQSWGPNLEQLPLPGERATVRAEQYDLLLLMAQLASRQPEKSKDALAFLERAGALQEKPSRGFYRLRALCY